MSYPSRRIQAVLEREAAILSQGEILLNWHTFTGPTAFDVPTDFTLVLLAFFAGSTTGGLFFRITTPDMVYLIPASGAGAAIVPPLTVKSGQRVTISLFNPASTTASAVVQGYGVQMILVPSVDWETQLPASLPPYFPPLA